MAFVNFMPLTEPQKKLIEANQSVKKLFDRMIVREEKSPETLRRYLEGVGTFTRYMDAESPDRALARLNEAKDPTQVLDGYVDFLIGKLELKSVNLKAHYMGTKKWLVSNRVSGIDWTYITRPKISVMIADRIPTKPELRRILTNKVTLRDKSFFMTSLSSGLRVGTLSTILVKEYQPFEELGMITVKGGPGRKLAKGKKYVTFITPETRAVLKEYLQTRGIDPDDLDDLARHGEEKLFLTPSRTNNITRQWRILTTRSRLGQKIEGHSFTVLHLHVLRKFFQTNLKLCGVRADLVDFMLGHHPIGASEYQNRARARAYFRPEPHDCAVEYRKAVSSLTIFEDADAGTQRRTVQRQTEEIASLKQQMGTLEHVLELLSKDVNKQRQKAKAE